MATRKLIEKAANGSALASHCKDIAGIQLLPKSKNKEICLMKCSPLFEAKNVQIVEAQWTEALIEEL